MKSIAFVDFEKIDALDGIQTKHKAWLEAYKGKIYSIALDEKHKLKWATEKKQYDKWKADINLIARLGNRTIIEYDGNEKQAKDSLEKTRLKLMEQGFGFIRSTHKGKSDYLWIEFTRNLTDKEVEQFLYWIAPKGSQPDLNFKSSKKVFQVLYAVHWRHSYEREMPIEYFKGRKIDFDALGIKQQVIQTITNYQNTFKYETSIKPVQAQEDLKIMSFKDFKKLKKDKSFMVENFLLPKTTNILHSPPALFKSLLAFELALSIATGKPFLKLKTKKFPVLICDAENNLQVIKDRWQKLHKGKNLRKGNYPLYVLKTGNLINEKKRVNEIFLEQLRQVIREKRIKLIIFDTLHRFAFYDENKSDDLNLLYMKIFLPLIEDFNLSILFLHHSTKPDRTGRRTYRGSSDLLGQVDSAYTIYRYGESKFNLICEKSRTGMEENISGEIDFDDDYIQVNRLSEKVEKAKKVELIKRVTDKIKQFAREREGKEWKRKDFIDDCTLKEFEFGSVRTIDRALKWLVENNCLDKNEKAGYTLIIK